MDKFFNTPENLEISEIIKYRSVLSKHISNNILSGNLTYCIRFLENAYNYKLHHLNSGQNIFNKNDEIYLISIAKRIYSKDLTIENIDTFTKTEILYRVPKYGKVFIQVHLTRNTGIKFLFDQVSELKKAVV